MLDIDEELDLIEAYDAIFDDLDWKITETLKKYLMRIFGRK